MKFFKNLFVKKESKKTDAPEQNSKGDSPETPLTESNQAVNSSFNYLPTFENMDSSITKTEIVSVVALTHTFLKLTYLNPFPFEKDPVFKMTYDSFLKSFRESLFDQDTSMEEKYIERHGKQTAEILMELAYQNWKVLDHYYGMGLNNETYRLALKPAWKCLEFALKLENPHIVINYAYLLLKDKSGILNNLQEGDILNALGNNSMKINFIDGAFFAADRLKK